ncbi:unnamed protein product [Ilex paraguariensis]|uniref:Translation initiation factor eIF2B subunit alpha n=1 Tax=Ilex paraguariensis TaxID=185542 RepID=A0ABC8USR1_9AQUA
MMELKKASDSVKSWDTTSISLAAGCDLFMHYVTRTSALEYEDFNLAKSRFLERSEKCGEISYKLAKSLPCLVKILFLTVVPFWCMVSLEFYAQGRPDRTGLRLSNELAKLDVLVKLLIDSAVAYNMDEVDMIFVGADGVVESGGIINMMGTYQIALVAKSKNRLVYVAAKSYKVCENKSRGA